MKRVRVTKAFAHADDGINAKQYVEGGEYVVVAAGQETPEGEKAMSEGAALVAQRNEWAATVPVQVKAPAASTKAPAAPKKPAAAAPGADDGAGGPKAGEGETKKPEGTGDEADEEEDDITLEEDEDKKGKAGETKSSAPVAKPNRSTGSKRAQSKRG